MAATETRLRSDQWTAELSDRRCECGCGQRTMAAPRSYSDRGVVKGEPRRFVAGHQFRVRRPRKPPREKFRLSIVRRRAKRPWPRCECGCGEMAAHRYARFARGHRLPLKTVRYEVRDCGFETPCWVWLLAVDVHGYPKATKGGVRVKAHRQAFVDAHGPVPADYDVHHRCEVKRCVNPDHLQALPHEVHGLLHRDRQAAA